MGGHNIYIPRKIIGIHLGLLYNTYAVVDARGIAPSGWSVPTAAQVDAMVTFLGGSSVAGGKLKSTDSKYWDSPNTGADDTYGFDMRGAGARLTDGTFTGLRKTGYFQTSTIFISPRTWHYRASNTLENLQGLSDNVLYGRSVRLIKNDSTDPGTMTDYDGNVYPTVKIDDQVWMAENLKVVHYNNGDSITEVTDNATWAALTSGAMCAYDNDWNNV